MEDQISIHSVDSNPALSDLRGQVSVETYNTSQQITEGWKSHQRTGGNNYFQSFNTKSDKHGGFWHLDSMDAEGNTAGKE